MEESTQQVSLVIEENTLEISNSGAITGVVYFDFGQKKFPEIGWNDFVVSILGWWLEAIKKIIKNFSDNEFLYFMDGPLHMNLTKKSSEMCLLECIYRGINKERLEFSQTVRINNLLSTILSGAKNVLEICKKKGWLPNDIDLLEELVNELKNVDRH